MQAFEERADLQFLSEDVTELLAESNEGLQRSRTSCSRSRISPAPAKATGRWPTCIAAWTAPSTSPTTN
jgi:hypothetical protein